jgi:phage-related minor tail protein
MSNPKDPFVAIDSTSLATVAGGRRAASSSRSDLEDRMMDMLNGIESAIKDLGRNQNNGNDAMSQLLPILALSMMNQPAAAQPQVVCQGRRGKKGW